MMAHIRRAHGAVALRDGVLARLGFYRDLPRGQGSPDPGGYYCATTVTSSRYMLLP